MVKVFIVCSGLGQVKRGFESFTQECFEALSSDSLLDLTLFKGGGLSRGQMVTVWNLPRRSWIATLLGKWIGRSPSFVEQVFFALGLLPHIQLQQPDLIYFSDGSVGNVLWHWRKLTHQRYKLLLSNGGPFYPPLLPRCDHVQQVAPLHLQITEGRGVPLENQSLLPYGIKITPDLNILSPSERRALRHQLDLPDQQPVVLSVGAINISHKRMDYVIREIASLPEPRPYLVLLGQQESESETVFQLANQLLEADQFQVKTVSLDQISDYYRSADIFVLASLMEGFGRVFLEAMSYGLPCLAHDYEVTRFVLGNEGYLANLELPGNLAGLIRQVLLQGYREQDYRRRHRTVYDRFSWEKLRPLYIQMIQKCAINEAQKAVIFL